MKWQTQEIQLCKDAEFDDQKNKSSCCSEFKVLGARKKKEKKRIELLKNFFDFTIKKEYNFVTY